MRILFGDKACEDLCSDERLQQRKLGAKGARKLRTRLGDLGAAARVTDLPAGRPHPLQGPPRHRFAVDLDGGRRLVFVPADDPPPFKPDGSVDWSQVTSIRIVFIGDYHD